MALYPKNKKGKDKLSSKTQKINRKGIILCYMEKNIEKTLI